MDIYSSVLRTKKITCKQKDALFSSVELVLKELQDELKRKGFDADVMLGGSAAKGTFVKDDFDCDIFIRFSKNYEDHKISYYLGQALKIFDGIQKVRGSRDYFQGNIRGIDYEFVPVRRISNVSEALNVTDASPLHVKWMENNIKNNPGLPDQIILTKLFCKAQRIYGAESYIKGFSGHVVDILVTYYKTFDKLLSGSLTWQVETVIDVEGHGTAEVINRSKINSLIVVDPIQPSRNAAAALSIDCMETFKRRASEFLDGPSSDFFEKKETTPDYLKSLAGENDLFLLEVIPLKGKEDVVGAKLLKIFEYMKKKIESNDFVLIDCGWEWGKRDFAFIWFITKPGELAKEKLREGPPLKEKKNAQKFMEKHKDYFVKDSRLYAYIKRSFVRPKDLISNLIREEYVKQRVKKIKFKNDVSF